MPKPTLSPEELRRALTVLQSRSESHLRSLGKKVLPVGALALLVPPLILGVSAYKALRTGAEAAEKEKQRRMRRPSLNLPQMSQLEVERELARILRSSTQGSRRSFGGPLLDWIDSDPGYDYLDDEGGGSVESAASSIGASMRGASRR